MLKKESAYQRAKREQESKRAQKKNMIGIKPEIIKGFEALQKQTAEYQASFYKMKEKQEKRSLPGIKYIECNIQNTENIQLNVGR